MTSSPLQIRSRLRALREHVTGLLQPAVPPVPEPAPSADALDARLILAVTIALNSHPKAHLEVLRGFFGTGHPLGLELREALLRAGNRSAQVGFTRVMRARGPLTLRERTFVYNQELGPSPTPIDEEYAARYLAQLFPFIDSV